MLSVLDELEELIPKIPESQKDDIQILWGNLRAQLYMNEGNLEQAEYELEAAKELLNTDDVEYSLNKDVYLDYSYARLYKEQGKFDEALEYIGRLSHVQQMRGSDSKKMLILIGQIFICRKII